ncbi:DUF4382 domain-containing protein [Microbulbifer sp. Q7]|uniref:DUF4382 domain-containing protein n=1 Tax=Microbulbifer sp. Q7 TaxID=1785091 RepID=UPI00082BE034|nr:DUF4382 domain-containing protein [Microbulbifer sp. Q7]
MNEHNSTSRLWRILSTLLLALALTACGSGNGSDDTAQAPETDIPPPSGAVCETADDDPTSSECGQVLVSMTDAEGDFVRYAVDVRSLSLERRDGTVVEVLPRTTTVDFSQYVELSELVTAATVPVGNYVASTITLDFSAADIQVEVDGSAAPAQVVDASGAPVTEVTLDLQFDTLKPLSITPGVPASLTVDFNLAASHLVDTSVSPARAELHPVLTAALDPVEQKEFRIRGPLIRVDESDNSYRLALRPFYRQEGRFGGINIATTAETSWDINGESYTGATGLSALAEQSSGTATLAFGAYDADTQAFTAEIVYAGSSLPGGTLDAVHGHVVARSGDEVTLKGARLIRADGSVVFNDTVTLQLGESTRVRKSRYPMALLGTDSLSVGQRISALGTWDGERLDASEGAVRLRLTSVSATLNHSADAELEVTALAFGARGVDLFDFTGTGIDPDNDADPARYQINLGGINPGSLTSGAPLRIRGFASPFGSAPADFDAVSVVDYSNAAAQLLVSWAGEGSNSALTQLDANGLQLNLDPELLGTAHHLRRGGIRTDLLAMTEQPLLAPAFDRGVFALVQDGEVTMHGNFGNFATDLGTRLDNGAQVKLLHGAGGFRDGQFNFMTISVILRNL